MDSDRKKILYHLLKKDIVKYLQRYKSLHGDRIPLKLDKEIFNYKISFSKRDEKNSNKQVVKNSEISLPPLAEQNIQPPLPTQTAAETITEKPQTAKTTTPAAAPVDNSLLQKELAKIKDEIESCTLCSLHKSRQKALAGTGSNRVKLVIIGEAPSAKEDKAGSSFAGEAGDLLTKMLNAINIAREDIFVCNVLKCCPPFNRDPHPEEVRICSTYLNRQLALLKPDYILCLGRTTAIKLLGKDLPMKAFRETMQTYKDIPVQVSYHPEALLRNQKWKRPAWEDLKKLQDLLGL